MGSFGPAGTPLEEWAIGHLRLIPDQYARLSLISTSVHPANLGQFDDADHGIVGLTEIGFVLLSGSRRTTGSRHLHGETCTVEVGNLVTGIEYDDIDQEFVVGASLHYLGLPKWMPGSVLTESYSDEHPGGWDVSLRHQEALTVRLEEGWFLHLQASWTMSGVGDARTYTTPLAVRTESDSREELGQHLVRLDAVNSLLVLAHPQDVRAISGFVRLTSDARSGTLWDRDFMRAGPELGTNEFAVFGLEHLGGIEGVAGWVRLCLQHRRVVQPLVRHRLFEAQSPESRLLATCAAAEYWVSHHSKLRSDWARGRKNYDIFPALVTRVHSNFREWISRPSEWSDLVWRRYSQLKHDPSWEVDPNEVAALELSARWLLTAVLLNSCAESLEPGRQIFDNRLWQERDWIQRTLFC